MSDLLLGKHLLLDGKSVIFNHVEFTDHLQLEKREGSEKDVENLQRILPQIGLQLEVINDPTYDEIMNYLQDDNNSDITFIFVATHGCYGLLAAKDRLYDPTDLFNAAVPKETDKHTRKQQRFITISSDDVKQDEQQEIDKEKSFGLDPKIFIIEACNYIEKDLCKELQKTKWSSIPQYEDQMVIYAAPPGISAKRDKKRGTYLIRSLYLYLKTLPQLHFFSITELQTKLTEIVSAKTHFNDEKQVPYTSSTLRNKVFLVKRGDAELLADEELSETGHVTQDGKPMTYNKVDNTSFDLRSIIEQPHVAEFQGMDGPQHNGVALLINNRSPNIPDHPDVDFESMKSILPLLGFKEENIHFLEHENRDNILRFIDSLKENFKTKKPPCFLVIASSHGNSAHLSAGEENYPITKLWWPFRGEVLKGIPKVYFIDACETNLQLFEVAIGGVDADHSTASQSTSASSDVSLFTSTVEDQRYKDENFVFCFGGGARQNIDFLVKNLGSIYLMALRLTIKALYITTMQNVDKPQTSSADDKFEKKISIYEILRFMQIIISNGELLPLCRENMPKEKLQVPNYTTTLLKNLCFPLNTAVIDQVKFNLD